VVARFAVPGTLAADARPLGAAEGLTSELLLTYELPTHAAGLFAVIGKDDARALTTTRDGERIIALLQRQVPAWSGPDSPYARYVTRSASPRGYDQHFATSWERVARPWTRELTERTRELRGPRAPVAPRTSGAEAVAELTRWVRDRLQRDDALTAPWDAGRAVTPLLVSNDFTATDKVHLLMWLLDAAGLAHQPAMARPTTQPPLLEGLPTPGGLSIPLVYATESKQWLDPGCRTCEPGEVRPSLRAGQALLLPPGDPALVTLPGERVRPEPAPVPGDKLPAPPTPTPPPPSPLPQAPPSAPESP
jgi:hypothetical protein